MKKLLSSLSLFALLPLNLFAGEPINQTRAIPSNAQIKIESPTGLSEIKTWHKNEFSVQGELDDAALKYELVVENDEVVFEVKMPRRSNHRNSEGSQLTFFVPHDSQVHFEGINTQVMISGVQGGSDIETVNGEIEASNLGGDIRLNTVNGRIQGSGLNGDIRYSAVNGNIDDKDSKGTLRFEAVNGDLTSDTQASSLRAESVNGEINFTLANTQQVKINTVNGQTNVKVGALLPDAQIEIETVSGSVTLSLPKSLSAKVEVQAHAGGKISNSLTTDKVKKAKYGPSSSLKFDMGSAQADIEIDTINGHIRLKKN